MSDETELLTYKELAARLGVKLASARQTVSRRRWKRVPGNNGAEIRIAVPVDYLQRYEGTTEVSSETPSEGATVDMTVENARLSAENEYLKKRIDDLECDRDAWRTLAQKSWWRRLVGA